MVLSSLLATGSSKAEAVEGKGKGKRKGQGGKEKRQEKEKRKMVLRHSVAGGSPLKNLEHSNSGPRHSHKPPSPPVSRLA